MRLTIVLLLALFAPPALAADKPIRPLDAPVQELIDAAGAWVNAMLEGAPDTVVRKQTLLSRMEVYRATAPADEAREVAEWEASVRTSVDIPSMKGFWEESSDFLSFHVSKN